MVGGLEKKIKSLPEEKETIAYHGAGHAIVSWRFRICRSTCRAIVPRGQSLGAAWYLPEERQIVRQNKCLTKCVLRSVDEQQKKLFLIRFLLVL